MDLFQDLVDVDGEAFLSFGLSLLGALDGLDDFFSDGFGFWCHFCGFESSLVFGEICDWWVGVMDCVVFILKLWMTHSWYKLPQKYCLENSLKNNRKLSVIPVGATYRQTEIHRTHLPSVLKQACI